MKFAVRFVLTLLAIAAVVVVVGPSVIDWNRFKPQIEARLERAVGRDVTLGGKIGARFLPTPHLEADDVTIANASGGEAASLLHLKSLQGQIAFTPLLSGRLVVKGLRLVEPVISLERMPGGAFNFTFAGLEPAEDRSLALYEKADPSAEPALTLDPDAVSIDKIEIVKGTLNYHDRVMRARETFTTIDGVMSAATLAGPYSGEAGFAWQGRRWGLEGLVGRANAQGVRELTLKASEAAALLKASLIGRIAPGAKESKIPWTASGALVLRAERPEGIWQGAVADPARPFALEGAATLDPARLRVNDIAMRWGDFTGSGTLDVVLGDKPHYLLTGSGRALDLDALLPAPADDKGAKIWPLALVAPAATVAQAAPDATPTSNPAPRGLLSALPGEFDIKLASIAYRQGEVTGLAVTGAVNETGLVLTSANAVLPGKSELNAEGIVTRAGDGLRFKGGLALASEDARALLGWFGFPVDDVARERLRRVAFNGGVALAPGELTLLNFQSGLDGAQAKGQLSATVTSPEARPRIAGQLQFTRVNLAPYRTLFGPDDKKPLIALIDDMVEASDGTLTLAIDSLAIDTLDIRGVTAEVAFNAGRLKSKLITLDDVEGVKVAVEMDETHALAGRSTLSWRGALSGEDLRPVLAPLHLAVPHGDKPVGPFTFLFDAAIEEGTGNIVLDGALAGAQVILNSDLNQIEAPLRGIVGAEGSTDTTLTIEASDRATAMGALLGFGDIKTGATVATSLSVHYVRQPERAEFALNGLVGQDATRLSWERKGHGPDAAYRIDFSGKAVDPGYTVTVLGGPTSLQSAVAGPWSMRIQGEGPANRIALSQIAYQLGRDEVTGTGVLDLSGAQARTELDLKATHLDIDRYAKIFNAPVFESGRWSERKLVLTALGDVSGKLTLATDALTFLGTTFENVSLDAGLKEGALTLSDLQSKWAGGVLTANAVLRGGTALPGLALATKFSGVDMSALSAVLVGKDFSEGRVDGAITLKSQGETARLLASGASGEIRLKGTGGAVHGFDLAAFDKRRAQLRPGDKADTVVAALTGGTSAMTACDLAFTVDQGVATTSAGVVDFPQGRALLTGAVDLAARGYALDLNLPATGLTATPHIAVSGPFDKPQIRLVSAGVAEALKSEAEARPPQPPPEPVPAIESAPPSVMQPGEPDRLRGIIDGLPTKTQ